MAVTLTAREIEILKLVGEDLTSAEIASALRLSKKTVETHRYRINLAMGTKTGAGALMKAIRLALICP